MCIRYIRIYSHIPVFVYKQKRVKIISSVRIYIYIFLNLNVNVNLKRGRRGSRGWPADCADDAGFRWLTA